MRINTRFPVAVHILTLVAFRGEDVCTSELLAKSVNTNPAVIRRMLSTLKKANLVGVRRGVGGAYLTRPAEKISLLDVYNAVKQEEDKDLFDVHPNPNPKCFVGANIHKALEAPLADAQQALEESLSHYTIADVVKPISEITGRRALNTFSNFDI